MATTAELIEKMTDAGKFEILASRVLRFLSEDCRSLAHLGVNAEGKTVPSPIDGFHLIPHSKPHRYVMSAYTLSRDLKRKWLFEGGDVCGPGKAKIDENGDLVKAGMQAREIRTGDPDAQFTLHLCTNRILKQELMQTVYGAASKLQISVQFLEQSQIRDFLDTTEDGQWLRQDLLGVIADRVSYGLLHDLCVKNLRAYRSDTQIVSSQIVVPTTADRALASVLADPGVSLLFLAGPSGSGKSVLAQTALDEHIQAGGLGIRIAGEVADRAIGLHDALGDTLRSLHGRLDSDAGGSALRVTRPEGPFLIVIDDVNRTPHPKRVLDRIISWARPIKVGAVSRSPKQHPNYLPSVGGLLVRP